MKGILKKYWYLLMVVGIVAFLLILNHVCQTSAHKKISLEDVEKAYIYDVEMGSKHPIEGEELEELIEMLNDVSGVKREYDSSPGTMGHSLGIVLKNGENLTMYPMGGKRWYVQVSGREWNWMDKLCAENGIKDAVMYIGTQEELHPWYDEKLELYNIE